ncbi:hypothetical protein SAMN02746066_04167 [Anaerosporobacter mobilis DSM 15930]|jgi:hypothetical protein|uniref:Uncharacterized protein n=1 Tax=Anaerosporobacter mobilis DSM 15930 TaxID=1120996 RepID=A0A1M7N1Z0_9FIRM|nr:hypothetical protein [Anaerosporobacter mobilis]SHM97415.1 hypothetical protein SAMN02746066_04167 [Anaerosporobacter mobilis DSM 15930]
MKISKTLENAIEAKDLSRIYSSFYTIALADPSFSTGKFRNTLEYVKSLNIPGFMQPYSGGVLQDTDWSEEYWGIVASELMDNFCEERINHLERVGKTVYKTVYSSNVNKSTLNDNVKKKKTTASNGEKNTSIQPVLLGAVVLVIVLLVILMIVKNN